MKTILRQKREQISASLNQEKKEEVKEEPAVPQLDMLQRRKLLFIESSSEESSDWDMSDWDCLLTNSSQLRNKYNKFSTVRTRFLYSYISPINTHFSHQEAAVSLLLFLDSSYKTSISVPSTLSIHQIIHHHIQPIHHSPFPSLPNQAWGLNIPSTSHPQSSLSSVHILYQNEDDSFASYY